jgi:POT family proton-dependent oligopeptide transporter
VVFLLCPIVLLMGHKRYVCSPPSGSVLSKALRAWKLAAKGRWSFNPVKFIRNFRAANFWDQAKPSHLDAVSQPKPRWMTYDDNWIDELRRGFKACSVFVWYPIYCKSSLNFFVHHIDA